MSFFAMKVIHITAKVLLKIASIALIAILAISVIPIVSGGIGLDVKKDPTATKVGTDTIRIEGSFAVDNNLMWDITDFSYSVKIRNELFTAAEFSSGDRVIAKGTETELDFLIEISMTDMILMMIGGAVEPGGTIGSLKIPLSLNVRGSYIQGLIGFDVSLDLSAEMEDVTGGSVTYDDVTDTLSGTVSFDGGDILSGMAGTTFTAAITAPGTTVNGNATITIDASGTVTVTFDLFPAGDLSDALGDSIIQIEGMPLSAEQNAQFVDMIEFILETIGGSP